MKFRTKETVEAFKYDGDFISADGRPYVPEWAIRALDDGILYYGSIGEDSPPCELFLKYRTFSLHVPVGNYLIYNPAWLDSIVTLTAEDFLQSYEPVEHGILIPDGDLGGLPENCFECPCMRHDSLEGVHAYQCNATLRSFDDDDKKNMGRCRPYWCELRRI